MGIKIALCGNPNCGKTTLYNALTGQRQYVGNWAGVTVEKKEGVIRGCRTRMVLADLPGIYSLSPYSMEERVARDMILRERPDVILNILDGTNLERNLYLSLQLLELQRPMVMAINMMDEVHARSGRIDCAGLSVWLGVPVIPISARRGEGVMPLLRAVEALAMGKAAPRGNLFYEKELQSVLDRIAGLAREEILRGGLPSFFCATRLFEGDDDIRRRLALPPQTRMQIESLVSACVDRMGRGDRECLLADARYRLISRLTQEYAVKKDKPGSLTLSDRIDRIVTGRILALPVFLGILWAMFSVTFGPVGMYLKSLLETGISRVFWGVRYLLEISKSPEWAYGLLLDAVVGGVGGVLVFLPQILLLFLFLSLMEDSGYMARAAFIMDRLLRRLGLTGKSFIPMLMGFGCTTPAVMAARALDNERERRITILLTPFMSCGARLPIYALFAGAFFPGRESLVVLSMYLLGMAVAILCGILLRQTVFMGEEAPFVMELPPYRLPALRNTLRHMWEKAKGFLLKAGTIIFSMNVLIWVLQHITPGLGAAADVSQSIFGLIGMRLAPLFAPLGFGNWEASCALLTGLVAKESVVGTLGVLYSAANGLEEMVLEHFTPLSALSFMTFSLLYMPCISAFVSICRELGSLRTALKFAAFQTGVAYAVSYLVYTGGMVVSVLSH